MRLKVFPCVSMCRVESIENYNKICSKYKGDFSKVGSPFNIVKLET